MWKAIVPARATWRPGSGKSCAAGKDIERLTSADLATVDEFRIRGPSGDA